MLRKLLIFVILFLLLLGNLGGKSALAQPIDDYPTLSLSSSPFYLTGTPQTHFQRPEKAAIDLQYADEAGFVVKGMPIYAPISGYATYSVSDLGSGVLEITAADQEWKVQIAHVVNDVKRAEQLLATYPKYVKKGELLAFQGDSGYYGRERVPVHVHLELYKLREADEYPPDYAVADGYPQRSANEGYIYTNYDSEIRICSMLRLEKYCEYVDEVGWVMVKEKL